jgi:N-acetylglucosamine-6-phosphate deacetylase
VRLGVEAALVEGTFVRGGRRDRRRNGSSPSASPGGAGRGIAIPGFVDLQVNGFGGVDFLDADAEGYRRAGEALLETGVTSYLPTLITSPSRRSSRRCARCRTTGAAPRILGVHLEGPFLAPSGSARTCLGAARPGLAAARHGCSTAGRCV